MTGLVIFAHGSTLEEANRGVEALTQEVATRGGYLLKETAFLDCAPPDLREAVTRLAARGATRVVVVPFFLTLGIHMRRDLPAIVAELQQTHGELEIAIAPPLEGHPALIDIVLARAEEATDGGGRPAGETR